MSSISNVTEAFNATVGSGTTISGQANHVAELKTNLETIIASLGDIDVEMGTQVGVQTEVTEYFKGFMALLAQNEAPTDKQEEIISYNDGLIEHTNSIREILITTAEHLTAAIEMFDSISAICESSREQAEGVGGMISASASSS